MKKGTTTEPTTPARYGWDNIPCEPRYERYKIACREPVDIEWCRKQLSLLLGGYFGEEYAAQIRVPVDINDADIVLVRALDELERMRTAQNSSDAKESCP